MDGLTASRLKLLGDSTRWKRIAGAFLVTNEWLKLDQRTLFVERELGEVLKRTDLPEGVLPPRLSLAVKFQQRYVKSHRKVPPTPSHLPCDLSWLPASGGSGGSYCCRLFRQHVFPGPAEKPTPKRSGTVARRAHRRLPESLGSQTKPLTR